MELSFQTDYSLTCCDVRIMFQVTIFDPPALDHLAEVKDDGVLNPTNGESTTGGHRKMKTAEVAAKELVSYGTGKLSYELMLPVMLPNTQAKSPACMSAWLRPVPYARVCFLPHAKITDVALFLSASSVKTNPTALLDSRIWLMILSLVVVSVAALIHLRCRGRSFSCIRKPSGQCALDRADVIQSRLMSRNHTAKQRCSDGSVQNVMKLRDMSYRDLHNQGFHGMQPGFKRWRSPLSHHRDNDVDPERSSLVHGG